MSVRNARQRGFRPGLGAFVLGISLICAASILNIAHDRIFADQTHKLPEVFAWLYQMSGKQGVTLVFAGLGVLVIVMGGVIRGMTARPAAVPDGGANPSVSVPYFITPTAESLPDVRGGIVLETRKYLPQAHPSPGRASPVPQPAQR
jgi:hypothetical protein